jgi:hypothetical protein
MSGWLGVVVVRAARVLREAEAAAGQRLLQVLRLGRYHRALVEAERTALASALASASRRRLPWP